MILLIGTDEDPTILHFENFLKANNINYFFLNQKLLANEKIQMFSEFLTFNDKKYYYSSFTGTLNRMSSANSDDITGQNINALLRDECILNFIMSYKLQNVLNLNRHSISNDSKLFQLNLLDKYIKWIKIPDFVVLKGLNIVDTLYEHSKSNKHIIKSLSSIRSIVKDFESNKEIFFSPKSNEPVLFQELLDGVNIRVHVIDNYIFAVKILSDSIDYNANSG